MQTCHIDPRVWKVSVSDWSFFVSANIRMYKESKECPSHVQKCSTHDPSSTTGADVEKDSSAYWIFIVYSLRNYLE